MEAIGEDLGRAYDAGSRLPRPAHLHPVPSEEPLQPSDSGPGQQDVLDGLGAQLAAAALAAPGLLATASHAEAADFAARVEGLARSIEYLQLLAAGAVDRTRTQAINDAAAAKTRAGRSRAAQSRAASSSAGRSTGWITGWDANSVGTLNTTETPHTSPADDGCRNTAEFLRLRLQIPIREARRRLTLAHHVLPGTSITGEPLPPTRPHLAAALTPTNGNTTTGNNTETATTVEGTTIETGPGPAVSSHAATIITATLDRLRHHTTEETLDRIEHHLTTAATTTDPDFLTRLAQRWTDTIDADGTEPTEEALRHTQGAFIRKPRHGLHHLEIFATTDQYEHLLTVMNTATNPRTTTGNTSPSTGNDTADRAGTGTEGCTGTGTGTEGSTATGSATWHTNLPDLDRRTRAQKQLDGLVTAAKAALTTNTLPTTGGNRPQIIATIHYQDLFPANATTPAGKSGPTTAEPGTNTTTRTAPRTGAGTGTGTGTFMFTGPVAAATLRKTACDADIIPALLGTNSEILDLGRKTRLFTPAQRLALTARDQGCAFPNCTIPAPWCEAHHITYWSHEGPTTTNNGVLLCSHHHHLIHKEQWTITTTHHTPTFIPPPHLDPHQTPQQNHYFKPPPPHPHK
ncbi:MULTISPECIES: HNH endonuclease signature motif containing protein [unclassified Arthrobacter]|uniref:HNH endonuclease signature motif containing protein n=1 Tax=unclassified Arthrobacter TaxID=235627 RepID=UPI001F2D1388|nr:HNH endonuclease signature motif containing protein [Arthrobacter sp. FW306-06-A]UKA72103.1 HNH endonuclease [Arthrobacter sp. FW306-06-A]